MRSYQVRFHLGAGQHYKHWQVKHYDGPTLLATSYWNPDHYQILMAECQLANRPKKAEQVFNSQRRDVCGWIKCYSLVINKIDLCGVVDVDKMPMVVYDPKVQKHWHFENQISDIDCKVFDRLITYGKRVYWDERRTCTV